MTHNRQKTAHTQVVTILGRLPSPLQKIVLQYLDLLQPTEGGIATLTASAGILIRKKFSNLSSEELEELNSNLAELGIEPTINTTIQNRLGLLQKVAKQLTPAQEIKLDSKQDSYSQYQSALQQFDFAKWLYGKLIPVKKTYLTYDEWLADNRIKVKKTPQTIQQMCAALNLNENELRECIHMCCDASYLLDSMFNNILQQLVEKLDGNGHFEHFELIQLLLVGRIELTTSLSYYHGFFEKLTFIVMNDKKLELLDIILKREDVIKHGREWKEEFRNPWRRLGTFGLTIYELINALEYDKEGICQQTLEKILTAFNDPPIKDNAFIEFINKIIKEDFHADSSYKLKILKLFIGRVNGPEGITCLGTVKKWLSIPTRPSRNFFSPLKKETLAEITELQKTISALQFQLLQTLEMKDEKASPKFFQPRKDNLVEQFAEALTLFDSSTAINQIKTILCKAVTKPSVIDEINHTFHCRINIDNLFPFLDWLKKFIEETKKEINVGRNLIVLLSNCYIAYVEASTNHFPITPAVHVMLNHIDYKIFKNAWESNEAVVLPLWSELNGILRYECEDLNDTDRFIFLRIRMIESLLPVAEPYSLHHKDVFACYAQFAESSPRIAKIGLEGLPKKTCTHDKFTFTKQYMIAALRCELQKISSCYVFYKRSLLGLLAEIRKIKLAEVADDKHTTSDRIMTESVNKILELINKQLNNNSEFYQHINQILRQQEIFLPQQQHKRFAFL